MTFVCWVCVDACVCVFVCENENEQNWPKTEFLKTCADDGNIFDQPPHWLQRLFVANCYHSYKKNSSLKQHEKMNMVILQYLFGLGHKQCDLCCLTLCLPNSTEYGSNYWYAAFYEVTQQKVVCSYEMKGKLLKNKTANKNQLKDAIGFTSIESVV